MKIHGNYMQAIEIKNLKKYFGKVQAVNNISFSVAQGEIFGFLGPNGAGKTTTIRCLMDFIHPDSGEIKILGSDSHRDSVAIKEKIGFLSGDVRLYENYTGLDHIHYLEQIHQKTSIARDLAKKLDFNLKTKFRTLSSGNKQKMALILALMNQPELIILDEPTTGLDPILQNTVYNILEDFKAQGSTIFMSSHNLSEVERICSRVAIIRAGKIVATENIQTLKDKRMHKAIVHFSDHFTKSDFNFDGVEVQEELKDGLILNIKGNVDPLIKKLAKYKIKDLEITHAPLEEIFLEFYKVSTKTDKKE